MSSARDQQIQQAREIDKLSTLLVEIGINTVKKNPIKVSMYFIGLLVCLLFNGFTVDEEKVRMFEEQLAAVDYLKVEDAQRRVYIAEQNYYQTKGWFSCNSECQLNKLLMQESIAKYREIQQAEEKKVHGAKSNVGIFSEYGVSETRVLFWERFGQGKAFAVRQSKWDALFIGISAMGRDESLPNYILRIITNALFNFTIGVIGAVLAFIFSLYSLIKTYEAPLLVALPYFIFATLAAVSFALTWLIALYIGTAGTVYVGAKFLASNLRVQSGQEGGPGGPRRHVRYE